MTEIHFRVWNIKSIKSLFESDPLQFKERDIIVQGPKGKNTVDNWIKEITSEINEMDVQALVLLDVSYKTEELQLIFNLDEVIGEWKCAVQQANNQFIGLAIRIDTGFFQHPPYVIFD